MDVVIKWSSKNNIRHSVFRLYAAMTPRLITQAIQSNPVFRVSSFLGMFPFRVIDDKLKADNRLFLYSFVISSLFTSEYVYSVVWGTEFSLTSKNYNWESFNQLMFFINVIFQSSSFLSFPLLFYQHHNAVVEMVDSLDSVESLYPIIDGRGKMKPIQDQMRLEITAPILFCICFYLMGNSSNIVWTLILSLYFLEKALCYGQFINLVGIVSEFYKSSTNFLKRMQHPISINNQIIIEKIVDSVGQLVLICSKINSIYSLQLLCVITHCYSGVIFHLYFVFENFNSYEFWKQRRFPGDCLFALYRLFVAWRVVHSAAMAHYKVGIICNLILQ